MTKQDVKELTLFVIGVILVGGALIACFNGVYGEGYGDGFCAGMGMHNDHGTCYSTAGTVETP